MVSSAFKPAVNRFIEPIARLAIRAGITPNAVTVGGTIGTAFAAIYFYPQGNLFVGTLVIVFFALSDLFDGAIARLSKGDANICLKQIFCMLFIRSLLVTKAR